MSRLERRVSASLTTVLRHEALCFHREEVLC